MNRIAPIQSKLLSYNHLTIYGGLFSYVVYISKLPRATSLIIWDILGLVIDLSITMTCRFFAAMVHLLNKLDDDDICQYYLFIAVDNKSQGRFWRRRKITVN